MGSPPFAEVLRSIRLGGDIMENTQIYLDFFIHSFFYLING